MSTLTDDLILSENILDDDPCCESVNCREQRGLPPHPASVRVRFPCGGSMLWCGDRLARHIIRGTVWCTLFCGGNHDACDTRVVPL